MTRIDLDNPLHVEILVKLGEEGWASGIAEDFDMDAFIEETDTIVLTEDPKEDE